MITPQKIDEWLKEVEARPESATLILKYVTDRLRDLSARNEVLQAENIALVSGKRVEEYEKKIAHLEYQLDLLRRSLGSDEAAAILDRLTRPETLSLLVYTGKGRMVRFELGKDTPEQLGQVTGDTLGGNDAPRLLALPSRGDVLLLFSSGRVSVCPLEKIPLTEAGTKWEWSRAALPDEPHGGETLVCLAPLGQLPLVDFFLQASRRGSIKKTMASMSQSIFSNHYIGKNIVQKADQPFELTLCRKQERLALVTHEGRAVAVDIDSLSYSAEEHIKLSGTDHVVSAFLLAPEESLLALTQTGKVLQRQGGEVDLSQSALAKGQALISPNRLEQGVRLIGASSVRETDRAVVLEADGLLTVRAVNDLLGSGSVGSGSEPLAFTAFRLPKETTDEHR